MATFNPGPLPLTVTVLPRKPLTSGQPHRRVTHFPSLKTRVMVPCASRLHADFCLHLEFEPRVIAYASRPFALQFGEGEITARPDFAAILADGRRVYYQVSGSDLALDPRRRNRLSLARQCFGNAGLLLEQLNPDLYQTNACTQTLRSLYHHAFGGTVVQVPQIRQLLSEDRSDSATIRYLTERGIRKSDIAFAIFYQHIYTDLHKPVDLNTRVEVR
ncbi:hypothetical protein PS718_00538 [Pseudomonas fluorescens]|uniref:TnsA endonuclease N-terminal domain-containing protein n=1 Tax=Pseudomonas fluorescens TaxID=294 RepID=A0A5E7A224_PSEFL|nr:hypothetical protein [Pseudomonas fluorescens]VVN72932.1 hypothetical protein PS718_00538 [Pseudomonas fluorescens]